MDDIKKHYLLVMNDGPYGDERPYNALRVAMNLAKRDNTSIRLFLIGDGVQCAVAGQETPKGYYNIERMVRFVLQRGDAAT